MASVVESVLVALSLWLHHEVEADARALTGEILWVVLSIAVIPWRHVGATYLLSRGDRWRLQPRPERRSAA